MSIKIKIKNLKRALLIFACILFAGVNYITYVKADTAKDICNKTIDADCDGLTNDEETVYGTNSNLKDTDGDGYSDGVEVESGYDPLKKSPDDKISKMTDAVNETTSNSIDGTSMTDEFVQKLDAFAKSKEGSAVSASDVESLSEEVFAGKMAMNITWESLPQVDISELKILKQPYSQEKTDEARKKVQEDASNYFIKMGYLMLSNAPSSMLTDNELKMFAEEMLLKLSSLSTASPDFEYFTEVEKRFGLISSQAKEIEVPETMLDLHVKFIRWTKGFSALSEMMPSGTQDPMANMLAISQISNYMNMVKEFAENDLQKYINDIK